MGVKFSVAPMELVGAGDVLRDAQRQSDEAVLAFCRAGTAVTGRPEHAGIGEAAARFGDAMASALADLGRSAQGLASAVDTSAELYVSTDAEIAYRFGPLSGL